jgi:hypothetical protein
MDHIGERMPIQNSMKIRLEPQSAGDLAQTSEEDFGATPLRPWRQVLRVARIANECVRRDPAQQKRGGSQTRRGPFVVLAACPTKWNEFFVQGLQRSRICPRVLAAFPSRVRKARDPVARFGDRETAGSSAPPTLRHVLAFDRGCSFVQPQRQWKANCDRADKLRLHHLQARGEADG